MFRAALFDFDGVIVDSEPVHLKAFNMVLAAFDIEIPLQDYRSYYLGLTDYDCFDSATQRHGVTLDEIQLHKLIRQKCDIYAQMTGEVLPVTHGIVDFLTMLKNSNVRIAICSGATRRDVEYTLELGQLGRFFETIVTVEDVKSGKPDPEGYLLALNRLNSADTERVILPGDCVVIEDSQWGLRAAKSAGMLVVAITNSYPPEALAEADKIISSFSDLAMEDLHEICNHSGMAN
ncbi:MAG: HAD family phosphatase [Planctomycetota bacterium]